MPAVSGGILSDICAYESAPVEEAVIPEADILYALAQEGIGALDMPGIYSVLDYEHDDSYARLGGAYRVAVVPCGGEDGYDVYYLEGARENASRWSSGMRKAKLRPSAFSSVFEVEWRDAEGDWMLHDVQAEYDALAKTITVKFPYQSASIRFRKE